MFCILVSVVCYFEFILKSKKLITDSEDRCRLKGTRQFAIGIFFFSLSSSLASRDSRSKMLMKLNFLLKYQMFHAWTLLWKKSENMVFHLRRSSSPRFVCLAVVFELIFQRSSIVERLCKVISVKQKMS